ncbi:hypothetical protein V6N13_112580 [Hibiscus sabdariffa]
MYEGFSGPAQPPSSTQCTKDVFSFTQSMLISSKDKESLRESTDSDEVGSCITGDVGNIDPNQVTLLVEPIKGNSNVGSKLDGYAFSYLAKKAPWGPFYFNPETKMIVGKKESAGGSKAQAMLVQFVLEPLWQAYHTALELKLQKTLNYACGNGANCSAILQKGGCYNPNTVKDHYNNAVNNYFLRKGQAQGSCDFLGTATVSVNPPPNVALTCNFPSSSTNSVT